MSGPPPIETGQARPPGWILAVGVAMLALGVVSFSLSLEGTNPDLVGPPPSGGPGPGPSDGPGAAMALIERAGCQACHGPDLAGQGNFPNLHGLSAGPKSENLQQLGADYPDTWANLWIDGTGPEVAGIDRLGMPAFGGPPVSLTPDEIATIVNYLLTLE